VGHIRRVKGFDVLLRTAAQVCRVYPKATFLIVGSVLEQDCDRELRELVRQFNLEHNVRFLGRMENESVWSLLKFCDVFCQPSRSEGMSNALLEAMGSGLPCVATAVGGTPEVLEDGRTGYIVPSGDHQAAAARILTLLDDPGRRGEMGRLARRVVEERFSAQGMIRSMVGMYDQLLETRRR
jgi:glycosyltransferase involved in cell wall biosynthesis